MVCVGFVLNYYREKWRPPNRKFGLSTDILMVYVDYYWLMVKVWLVFLVTTEQLI